MRFLYFVTFAAIMAFAGCNSAPEIESRPAKGATPQNLTPASARRRAQHDLAAGKPKIYLAGGFAPFEPGITDAQKALVAKLPRDDSLAGCTNPKVQYSIDFATAYNREIISLLQSKRGR